MITINFMAGEMCSERLRDLTKGTRLAVVRAEI